MKQEIPLDIKSEYKLLTISDNSSRYCLDLAFQPVIVEESEGFFPKAYLTSDSVVYTAFRSGFFPFSPMKRKPSKKHLEQLQQVIEKLHKLSEDPNIPEDRRICLKNFELPNPLYMPECWMTTIFPRRLIILWGVSKTNAKEETFLPQSNISDLWGEDDTKHRSNISDMFVEYDEYVVGDTVNKADNNRRSCFFQFFSMPFHFFRGCLPLGLLLLLILLLLLGLRSCFRHSTFGSINGRNNSSQKVDIPSSPSNDDEANESEIVPVNPNDSEQSEDKDALSPKSDDDSSGLNIDKPESPPIPDIPKESNDSGENTPIDDSESPSVDDKDSNDIDIGSTSDDPPYKNIYPDEKKPPNPYQIERKDFKVVLIEETPSSDETCASTKFQLKPIDDIGDNAFEVKNWEINGKVSIYGDNKIFTPDIQLRYDSVYVINASVFIKGVQQNVEPFQWNGVEPPTWQIFQVDNKSKDRGRIYRLKCCNSSLIEPDVQKWEITFRDNEKSLSFPLLTNVINKTDIELKRNIGFYEGAYFMEITANINYSTKGKDKIIKNDKHTETLPYSHDSSSESLERAKYETVIPHIYFCSFKTDSGLYGNGTAFAISEKHLLSNYHVAVGSVGNDESYKVVDKVQLSNGNGKTYYAKVVSFDKKRDLALLRLCNKDGNEVDYNLPGYLHLGLPESSSDERISQHISVFAIGYPSGTTRMGPPAFTDGKTENISTELTGIPIIVNYTRLKHGFSGGPLIDFSTGDVIGINFAGFLGEHQFFQGASLATPVSEVYKAFPDYIKPVK